MFDKSAAPTAAFVNQGDANYQHGYRIYANSLPQTEKTALYVVPSQLNNDAQRYGLTYLPGIGVTQSIYQNMPDSGPIGNLEYLTLTLPSGGVQWTDDMPTEWYIKDSEGWQDLGVLQFCLLANAASSFGVFSDNTAINANSQLSPIYSYSRTFDNGLYRSQLNNSLYFELNVTGASVIGLKLSGNVTIFNLTMGYNSEYLISVATAFSTDYKNNVIPLLLFSGLFSPVTE